ncbi:MAG TPA: flagellar basal body P-ring formation chaperone FlgA [Phenylobacterium sp.]|nr:flagellar basal body P-ring formation chaperone FlgA [Phenylobacterium sp.]
MRLAATLFAALLVAGPALAGQAVSLKSDVASADGVVTLGDLFDGAGAAGRTPVATRSGGSVVLDATAVQTAARRAGLDWANAEGLHKIIVRGGTPSASAAASAAHGNIEVLTYTRSLSAGEIVQPTDLAWIKAAAAPSDAPSDAETVIGQAAKRPLRAGAVVLAHDTGSAQVIKPGDIVSVTYEAEGVLLRLEGKSMGAAGVGETLAVQNTLSKKVVQTIVTGQGEAVVGPAADQMKSTRSLRYAVR